MDIYTKRTAGRIAGLSIPKNPAKNVLTDFQQEDLTVQLPPRLDVRDLEAGGNQLVPASKLLEREQSAAIEHSFEMPEPSGDRSGASQIEQAVVEEPREQSKDTSAGDENHDQRPQARSGNTIRVVISKQQLAKLLAEGSIKNSPGCKVLLPQCPLQGDVPLVGNMSQLISNATTTTRSPGSSPWSPRLDTVDEVPSQLTRSPVIPRNCNEVEHVFETKL